MRDSSELDRFYASYQMALHQLQACQPQACWEKMAADMLAWFKAHREMLAEPSDLSVILHRCGHESRIRLRPRTDRDALARRLCPMCERRGWRR